jgi:hypothetical protein
MHIDSFIRIIDMEVIRQLGGGSDFYIRSTQERMAKINECKESLIMVNGLTPAQARVANTD